MTLFWRAISQLASLKRRARKPYTVADDPIFGQFTPWRGHVKAGIAANFVGQMTDVSFVEGWALPERMKDRHESPAFPEVNEETFEWHSLLSAILDARERFVMIELGAGFGRWLIGAACAIRQRRPELSMSLVGVEAEPTHFQLMHKHFCDNGIDPNAHHLIMAPIAGSRRKVVFTIGNPQAWYGQSIVGDAAQVPDNETVEMEATTLADILAPLEKVDLIDMDIQGSELEVVQSSTEILDAKVHRIHIGTHSEEIEAGLRSVLGPLGWRCVWDFGCMGKRDTSYGLVEFQDGVQSWVNPRF